MFINIINDITSLFLAAQKPISFFSGITKEKMQYLCKEGPVKSLKGEDNSINEMLNFISKTAARFQHLFAYPTYQATIEGIEAYTR